MTEAEIIQKLAAIPCPGWEDYHTVGGINPDCCPHCDGSGARFPWLRVCDGRGWLPRLDTPLEEAISHLPIGLRKAVLGAWTGSLATITARSPGSIRLVFWQAVEQEVRNG